MSTVSPIPGHFRARLGLRVFDDRREFEKAARCFLGLSSHRTNFAIGESIYFDYDEHPVAAEVWSQGPDRGSYWARGDDGVTYLVGGKTRGWRNIQPCTNQGTAISKADVRRIRAAA